MASREQYLHEVCALILGADRSGTGIKASTLGNLILRVLGGHWQEHGFSTLKSLLEALSAQGKIRVGPDAQGQFSAWALPGYAQSASGVVSFQRLRKDVWAAFVNVAPSGPRYMHRTTGELLMGAAAPSAPQEDWIVVTPIPQESQKEWARELITALDKPELREALGEPLWYVRFPAALRRVAPAATSRWGALRSSRVMEIVERWAEKNGVARALLLEQPSNVQRLARDAGTAHAAARQRVLDALSKMSTRELLEIPIPAKYLLGTNGCETE